MICVLCEKYFVPKGKNHTLFCGSQMKKQGCSWIVNRLRHNLNPNHKRSYNFAKKDNVVGLFLDTDTDISKLFIQKGKHIQVIQI